VGGRGTKEKESARQRERKAMTPGRTLAERLADSTLKEPMHTNPTRGEQVLDDCNYVRGRKRERG
jgi:hypothetical protein